MTFGKSKIKEFYKKDHYKFDSSRGETRGKVFRGSFRQRFNVSRGRETYSTKNGQRKKTFTLLEKLF